MKTLLHKLLVVFCLYFFTVPAVNAADPDMPIGVCVHLQKLNKVEIDRQLDAVAQAHFKFIRWDIAWKFVEEEKGKFKIDPNWDYIIDKAKSRGIESIIILDYGNKYYDNGGKPVSYEAVNAFVAYASFLVNHFKGRVTYYEIWNEWNGDVGGAPWGKTKDYVALERATYTAIKKIDSNNIVIAGSFINYLRDNDSLQQFVDSDISDFCDLIALHPYVVYRGKELNNPDGFEKLLRSAVSKVRTNPKLKNKPLIITEIGWNTAIDHPSGVSEDNQREFLLKAIQISRKMNISKVIVYHLKDNNGKPNEPEGNFGLLRRDWSQKPIYRAFVNNEVN